MDTLIEKSILFVRKGWRTMGRSFQHHGEFMLSLLTFTACWDLSFSPGQFICPDSGSDWYGLDVNCHPLKCPSSSPGSVGSVKPRFTPRIWSTWCGQMNEIPHLLVTSFILCFTWFLPALEEYTVSYFSLVTDPWGDLKLLVLFFGPLFLPCMEKGIITLALCPVLLLYFFDLIVQRVSEQPQEPCLCMFKLLMLLK